MPVMTADTNPKPKTASRATRKPLTLEFTHSHSVVVKAGKKVVGKATAWTDSKGEFVMLNVGVSAPYKRRGVATTMYKAIEARAGRELKPAISLSDDAFEFWKNFRPESVARDLRHVQADLVGKRAAKAGLIGTITKASQGIATLVFDDHPRGPGTWSGLRRWEVNDALEAAGSARVLSDFMAGTRPDAPVLTPAEVFDDWFAGSKVCDEEGTPLIVYHGTSGGPFTNFDPGLQGQTAGVGGGFFFTRSEEVAREVYGWREDGRVMSVYLNLQKPLEYDEYFKLSRKNQNKETHGGRDAPVNYFDNNAEEITAFALAHGYDGIVWPADPDSELEHDLIVAFRADQICLVGHPPPAPLEVESTLHTDTAGVLLERERKAMLARAAIQAMVPRDSPAPGK